MPHHGTNWPGTGSGVPGGGVWSRFFSKNDFQYDFQIFFGVFCLLRGETQNVWLEMRSHFPLLLCSTSYAFGASSERCLQVSHTSPNICFLSSLRRSLSRAAARAPRAHHGVERVLPGQPHFSVDARKMRRFRHQAYLGPAAIRLHRLPPHRLLRDPGQTQRRYAAIPAPPPFL